ncbi:Ankyrin repeat domain-containing protein 13C [Mortierella claussenii]|nr:Ankyrin repeat domain-containing protein 13C [Mortierella claussenii]
MASSATAATTPVDPADPLALHKLVFLNKVHTLKMYLAPYRQQHGDDNGAALNDNGAVHDKDKDENNTSRNNSKDVASLPPRHPGINTLDNHLVTPLHLAVMLNRKDMVALLLKAGANPVARSGSGWTPRQEATSLGDREMIEILTRSQRKEFTVPFVSGLCPNDTYHIWKKGNCVRMDTSLVGFENLKWVRGHISIIFRVDPVKGPELVIVDRIKKITQRLAKSSDDEQQQAHEPTDEEIEDEVSICFNSGITSNNVPTSAIKFQRAKAGMWGYRTNKVEKVGEFECAVWKMDGVEFRTRVRTEHLKDEFGKPIAALNKKAVGGPKGIAAAKAHHHPHHHHEDKVLRLGGGDGVHPAAVAAAAGSGSGKGLQPRKPIHRPLFATFAEPESMEGSDDVQNEPAVATTGVDAGGEQPKQISFTASTNMSSEKNGGSEDAVNNASRRILVPKKHVRSTGTISDDAFFEAALEQAEREKQNGDGSPDDDEDEDDDRVDPRSIFRESLPPPPPPTITFEEYFDPSKQGELHLGRPLEQKESRKTFGATLWMYDNNHAADGSSSGTLHNNKSTASIAASSVAPQDSTKSGSSKPAAPQFPLTIEKILPLLEVVGMDNNRLVGKLKEFLEFQLPPGFPIRANIPVYPSLSADVTFVNYDAQREIEDTMFEVPGVKDGYSEGFVIRPGGEDDT